MDKERWCRQLAAAVVVVDDDNCEHDELAVALMMSLRFS